MIIVEKRSMLTGKLHTMELPITLEEYAMWKGGQQLIQQAFPHLTPEEREFLLTGSTTEEWDEVFGETEEDHG